MNDPTLPSSLQHTLKHIEAGKCVQPRYPVLAEASCAKDLGLSFKGCIPSISSEALEQQAFILTGDHHYHNSYGAELGTPWQAFEAQKDTGHVLQDAKIMQANHGSKTEVQTTVTHLPVSRPLSLPVTCHTGSEMTLRPSCDFLSATDRTQSLPEVSYTLKNVYQRNQQIPSNYGGMIERQESEVLRGHGDATVFSTNASTEFGDFGDVKAVPGPCEETADSNFLSSANAYQDPDLNMPSNLRTMIASDKLPRWEIDGTIVWVTTAAEGDVAKICAASSILCTRELSTMGTVPCSVSPNSSLEAQ